MQRLSTVVTLDDETRWFYRDCLRILRQAEVPYLVGGAYAFCCYTRIERHTRDLDIFLRPEQVEPALEAFRRSAYRAELVFPHWLAKVHSSDAYVDLIFSSGNGLADVDDEWFKHAVNGRVLGVPVRLCPPEEMIWQKAFIMERERFDGADVAHLLRARGRQLDWKRLLRRFDGYWRVLLSHLVLFGFIYPGLRHTIPRSVMRLLLARLERESSGQSGPDEICQGTLISREQYLTDVVNWGYDDARLHPHGSMTDEHAELWTAAIGEAH